jgi:N-acetylated-alpha-linked acidic dipeptidase
MEIHGSELEKKMLDNISAEEPWALVEKFSSIERPSATPKERKAIDYLLGRMDALGIPYTLYEPELYVSLPISAELEILTENGESIRCKTPSFSASGTIEGEVVYLPSSLAKQVNDFFNNPVEAAGIDLTNKIVMTDGISLPKASKELEDRGAAAQIYINPHPENMHELIITSIWGIPTLENIKDKPRTQVININRNTGDRIRHLLEKETVRCRITTRLDEGWKKAAIPVAEINGTETPEKFILLHGHLDSWHYGVTDNATGNAGKLEIARVFHQNRDRLKRSLRVAWWSGHSHGRYAGSTWYADFKGLDLEKNCIAQVNMDSPGVKWASRYDEMMWTAEVNDVCITAISETSGITPNRLRPMRAGDYSFNNIGITSFYMLSSNIPKDVKQEKGFYAVGGSGGNSDAWHNENDVLEFADPDTLVRDIKIYAATILRILNATVYPFDFARTIDESEAIVKSYQEAAEGRFDLQPVLDKLTTLRNELSEFNSVAEKTSDAGDARQAQAVNDALLRLGRILVSAGYAKKECFEHDPAVEVPPFPEIAPAAEFSKYPLDSDESKFLQNQLLRGRNKVLHRLECAREVVKPFTT